MTASSRSDASRRPHNAKRMKRRDGQIDRQIDGQTNIRTESKKEESTRDRA